MAASEDGQYDVVVIGGGFAGVTAARDLGQAGYRVLLLEARERLGGRTWYRPFAGTAHLVEFGGTWLATRWQPHVARELARYDLALTSSPEPESIAALVGGRRLEGPLPVPFDEIADLERALYHIMQASHRLDRHEPLANAVPELDVPLTEFLAPLALPPATHDLLTSYAAGMCGCDLSAVSALSVLSWVAAYDHSLINVYLGESEMLAQGTSGAIAAMIADSGAEVRLATPVQRVAQDARGVAVTACSGEAFRVAAAVVAVPLNVLGAIEFAPELRPLNRLAANEGHVGHATKVWALVRHAPRYFLGVGWGPGLVWLGTQRELPEGSLMVGFGWGPGVLNVHSHEEVQRAVQAFVPGAEVLAIDAHDWSADLFARGAWAAYGPGQLTRWGAALREPEGRLVFAGSDLATRWAGWIEGAIATGTTAAARVAAMLRG